MKCFIYVLHVRCKEEDCECAKSRTLTMCGGCRQPKPNMVKGEVREMVFWLHFEKIVLSFLCVCFISSVEFHSLGKTRGKRQWVLCLDSETPVVQNNVPLDRKPVIPKTNGHCLESPFLQKYTLCLQQ